MAQFNRDKARKKRHKRVKKKVFGTAEKPRLNVYRSIKNVHAQLIDDINGHTLAYASTLDPELKDYQGKNNQEASKAVGKLLAKRVKEKGVEEVVFDRGGYLYHGKVRALAEGAREEGLKF